MNNHKIIQKYCIGCGLCESEFPNQVRVDLNNKGFYSPLYIQNINIAKKISNFCPVLNYPMTAISSVWGNYLNIYQGFSNNPLVRTKGSSGGIITNICTYLLEKKLVDFILQIGIGSNPFIPELKVNDHENDVLDCAGSKYIITKPLANISSIMEKHDDKIFCFVGKPCDIRAIKKWLDVYPKYRTNFYCFLSFFCAGTPSLTATYRLVDELNLDIKNIKHINYRGNGWPGLTTVEDNYGVIKSLKYDDSWGKILGRDVYLGCKLCFDSVGNESDIATGDAWYLDSNNEVIFDEAEGRNVIFARTELGDKILNDMKKMNLIQLVSFDINELKYSQKYQFERKSLLGMKLLALKLLGQPIPYNKIIEVLKFARDIPIKMRIRVIMGAIKRVLTNKL